MLATEASGKQPVTVCQRRQSQVTSVSNRALQEQVANGLRLAVAGATGNRAVSLGGSLTCLCSFLRCLGLLVACSNGLLFVCSLVWHKAGCALCKVIGFDGAVATS